MAYESFYGGRQGASFVIVKQYDAIADMIAEFSQGGATVDQVNYGEYVIIDTENKNDPDNGKVYRRGMDYINEMGGAEYIGQIVGPEGQIRDLEVGNYNPNAAPKPEYFVSGGHDEYDPTELIPGKENNGIKYSQENEVETETGHITKYKIGFAFPYFQQDQHVNLIDPYDIPENLIEDITDETSGVRPFYREYLLKVPKGVKGDSIELASAIPTIVKKGSTIYLEENDGILSNIDRELESDLLLSINDFINYKETKTKNYINQKENNVDKYAYLTSTESQHTGFLMTDYTHSEEGSSKWLDAGIYNYIEEITIDNRNHLLVYYSDPIHRNSIPPEEVQPKTGTYKGRSTQHDLGYVKGEPGTSPIMGRVESLDDLYYDVGHTSPKLPEDVGGNASYKGQVVTIDDGGEGDLVYAYNYIAQVPDQYKVGRFGTRSGSSGGTQLIISETEPVGMDEGGIQGVAQTITCC